jgi:CRISPR-associated protein Cas1
VCVDYYSDEGHYFGKLSAFNKTDPLRQKNQLYMVDNVDFSLQISKKIVHAKLMGSIALLKTYGWSNLYSEAHIKGLSQSVRGIACANTIDELIGYEGNAAKNYFACLDRLIEQPAFKLNGRSSHPPKNATNSMLSFGYSFLYRNIVGSIEHHGLNPYFAFMHKLKFGHAALASDLIEDYRAFVVDQTVLNFVNSGEVSIGEFTYNDDGSVYLGKDLSKRLTGRFTEAVQSKHKYFEFYKDKKVYGFQVALDLKINSLIEAIEKEDPDLYRPFVWKYSHE